MQKNIKSICVYCGANFNGNPDLKAQIDILAQEFAKRDITLVFGGGRVGLMGIMADAVLAAGGKAIGVIPQFLMDKEVGHQGLTELIITENMHQRKQKMADLSDAFIILPGGFGTMEEFFEVLTWLQLGLHQKSIGILNFNGFYNPLLQLVDNMVSFSYLKDSNKDLFLHAENASTLIAQLLQHQVLQEDKWFEERNLI